MRYAKYPEPTQYDLDLDRMTKQVYMSRAQTTVEFSDEMWERIKKKFPGSVAQCREEAIEEMQDL